MCLEEKNILIKTQRIACYYMGPEAMGGILKSVS